MPRGAALASIVPLYLYETRRGGGAIDGIALFQTGGGTAPTPVGAAVTVAANRIGPYALSAAPMAAVAAVPNVYVQAGSIDPGPVLVKKHKVLTPADFSISSAIGLGVPTLTPKSSQVNYQLTAANLSAGAPDVGKSAPTRLTINGQQPLTGQWFNLNIGAAGWVTSIDVSPDGWVAGRTDVYSAYIMDPALGDNGKWRNLFSSYTLPANFVQAMNGGPVGSAQSGAYDVRFAPSNPTTMYAMFNGLYWKSTNRGVNWSFVPFPNTVPDRTGVNSAVNQNCQLYRAPNDNPGNGGKYMVNIAVDPVNENVVYVSFPNLGPYNFLGGKLCATYDGGQTWTSLPIPGGLDGGGLDVAITVTKAANAGDTTLVVSGNLAPTITAAQGAGPAGPLPYYTRYGATILNNTTHFWHGNNITYQTAVFTSIARTGNGALGASVITGLAQTLDLFVGMVVTGTGVAANTVILSIDSASQVTVSKPFTALVTSFTFAATVITLSQALSTPIAPTDSVVLINGGYGVKGMCVDPDSGTVTRTVNTANGAKPVTMTATIYANPFERGVWGSYDGGATWLCVSGGPASLPGPKDIWPAPKAIRGALLAPFVSTTVGTVGQAWPASNPPGGVWRYVPGVNNALGTWSLVNPTQVATGTYGSGQPGAKLSIDFNPNNHLQVVAVDHGPGQNGRMNYSSDGGATWSTPAGQTNPGWTSGTVAVPVGQPDWFKSISLGVLHCAFDGSRTPPRVWSGANGCANWCDVPFTFGAVVNGVTSQTFTSGVTLAVHNISALNWEELVSLKVLLPPGSSTPIITAWDSPMLTVNNPGGPPPTQADYIYGGTAFGGWGSDWASSDPRYMLMGVDGNYLGTGYGYQMSNNYGRTGSWSYNTPAPDGATYADNADNSGNNPLTGNHINLPPFDYSGISAVTKRVNPVAGNATVACARTAGLRVGQSIVGSGVPGSTYVLSISPNVSFTMTNPASGSFTNVALTFAPATPYGVRPVAMATPLNFIQTSMGPRTPFYTIDGGQTWHEVDLSQATNIPTLVAANKRVFPSYSWVSTGSYGVGNVNIAAATNMPINVGMIVYHFGPSNIVINGVPGNPLNPRGVIGFVAAYNPATGALTLTANNVAIAVGDVLRFNNWNCSGGPGPLKFGLSGAYYFDFQVFAADRDPASYNLTTNVGTLYMYASGGKTSLGGLFRTTDGGQNWTYMSWDNVNNVSTWPQDWFSFSALETAPHLPGGPSVLGHVYPVQGGAWSTSQKLTWTIDGGATWKVSNSLLGPQTVGFGAPKVPGNYPTMYFVGWYNTANANWTAADYGIWKIDGWNPSNGTWSAITRCGESYPLGSIMTPISIDGDKQVYGRVYVAMPNYGWAFGDFPN